ncbi:MAG: hypothetical protein ICCCNLDF_03235 [Planctomycetes bacterium]|nr:hypothetical protein [Planctomycetota bacterium]
MLRAASFLILALSLFGAGLSAQHTWTGATSTDWNTASNWSAASVPTATDSVIIPDTSALPNAPTLSSTATCNNLTIQANGVLNGGTGTLNLKGNWQNDGTYNAGTAQIRLDGTAAATIGGSSTTTINRLYITKTNRSVIVTQTGNLVLTSTSLSGTGGLCALDITSGTLDTAGFNLTAAGRVTGGGASTTPTVGGELLVSGASVVNLNQVYQWNLGRFTITGGTVTVAATHEIANSGHRFDISGGSITYTATGNNILMYTNNGGWGYFATGGTVSVTGNWSLSSVCHVVFSGAAVCRFIGSGNSTVTMNGSATSNTWTLPDLRVEKTAGTVSFTNSTNLNTNATIGALTVNAGGGISLGGQFGTGLGWLISSITSAGTVTLNSASISISGNITNTGTFTGAANSLVNLTGAAATTISGDVTFYHLNCTVAGRVINFGAGDTVTINGQMFLQGTAGNEIQLRSTTTGTQWLLQRNGAVLPRYCDVQDGNASANVYAQPGGVDSGNNTNWIFGGAVAAFPTTGATQGAWANDVSGLVSGTFVLENDAASAVTLNSITLGASGSGDDSTGYSEVALYVDNPSSGTQGSFDAADTLYDTAATAFAANDGTLTYTQSLGLAASSVTRFFVVVKFNGSTLPTTGQTFQVNVSNFSVTGAPASGTPSALMPGFYMLQPSVSFVAATPPSPYRPIAPTWTGPGGNGFQMITFTLTNNSPLPLTINFLRLYPYQSSGSGLCTYVALWQDTNGSGAWESASDLLIQEHASAWTTYRDFAFTGPNALLGPSEVRTFSIVVKLGGTAPANGTQFGHYVSSSSSFSNSPTMSGTQQVRFSHQVQTTGLHTVAEPGTKVEVAGTDNVQRQAGTFVMYNTSNATAVTLNSITLTASGTGFDQNGYSQVALYRDSNTNGTWDAGDSLAATAVTAFASDNGSQVFTLSTPLGIAGAASERFFVVVIMNGATTPQPGHTFKTRVTAISSTASNDGSGLASAIMEGIEILGNRLTVTATPGTAQQVVASAQGPGGNGLEAGLFTVANTGLGSADLLTITLRAAGTGDDSAAYSQVAIYRDAASGSVGSFDFANDILIDTAASGFSTDNGTLVFNVQAAEQTIAVSTSRTYFVVVKLNGSATANQTFQYQIDAITVGSGATTAGTPSAVMNGLNIAAPFIVTATAGTSAGATANATGPGGNGLQAGLFTVATPSAGGADLQSITITASGSGNDSTAYSEVAVYRDAAAGATGSFDFANDILIATNTTFPADNGNLVFNVPAAQQTFGAGETRTYFVVVKLNGSASVGDTFSYQVTAITGTPSGVSGLPSTVMAGINITNPIAVSATAGTAQNVYANATGTGGNGIQAGLFTVSCASGATASLLSVTIAASGSGDDSADYSEVALYRDSASGSVGSFDFANDVLIGTAVSAFPADNGNLTFNVQAAQQAFASGETRTFFIVVKLAGSAAAGETFQYQVTAVTNTPSGASGLPTTTMVGLSIVAPFTASATAGSAQNVYADSTGTGGNGVQAGVFTVANGAGIADLLSLTITASGTGDDSAAFSEVAIYRDSAAGATGSFDFANDVLIGSAATAFPSDNGNLTFNVQVAERTFAATETRTYFVVVKLNGSAANAHTFQFTLTGGSSSPTGMAGLPTTTMAGLVVIPQFNATATVGTAQNVYSNATGTGGNGVQAGVFSLQAGAIAANLTSFTISAGGTGDDAAAFSEVAVYRDSAAGATGSFDFANDVLIGSAATAFPADNGNLTFNVQAGQQAFSASESRTYFVVVKLNGTAATGHTFQFTVTAVTPAASGLPSTTMAGLVILAPDFNIADTSPATQGTGYAGTGGNVVQEFTISYPNGQNNTLTSLTFTGTTTGGSLQTDVTQADLYRDDNGNSNYDAGVDVLVNSQTGFNASNQVTFTLSGTESQFAAGDTREYFVVLTFDINTAHQAEFATQLTAASGAATGTNINGLPAPAGGPAPGLMVMANSLAVALNGPGAATTVDSNSQGPGGIGHVIWDGTLSTQAQAWTVTELQFQGTGTANHNTAYNTLGLYEDTNASGTYDAADQLAVAAAVVSFDVSNNYAAQLVNTAFPATTSRRFFLVGTLAGTATFGQTLNARLTGVQATPPTGGQVTGDVNVDSTALIIDAPAITIGNGPTPPANATLKAGTAQAHVIAKFRLTATNDNVSVTAITFTTAGTGNWATDMSATDGVQVYEDDGDGVFNAGTDTLLFQGAGASPTVTATFTTALQVANSSTKDIWVRVNVLATAGVGAVTSITYSLSVANASDVQAGAVTPLLGTPQPNSSVLSLVDFFVTTFTPLSDGFAGGASITITGSGFATPFTVTIGGVLCAGVPVITGGTQVTGLTVPPGSGTGLPIVITSGGLAPQTLTQTFGYSSFGTVGGGGGGGGGGGCAAAPGGSALLFLLAPVVALLRRRRKQK